MASKKVAKAIAVGQRHRIITQREATTMLIVSIHQHHKAERNKLSMTKHKVIRGKLGLTLLEHHWNPFLKVLEFLLINKLLKYPKKIILMEIVVMIIIYRHLILNLILLII